MLCLFLLGRGILGVLVSYSLMRFQLAVEKKINPSIAKLGMILTVIQFHFMFYSSRTLPNVFALSLGR